MEVSKGRPRNPERLMGRLRLLEVGEMLFLRLSEYKYTSVKNIVRTLSLDTARRFRTHLCKAPDGEPAMTVTRIQ